MIGHLTDFFSGKVPLGMGRSPHWPEVRDEHLRLNPECAVCGGEDNLVVHHIKAFHLNPELELEPSNLMTMCECKKYGVNCHLFIGHLGNFRRINPFSVADAKVWRKKLTAPTIPTRTKP